MTQVARQTLSTIRRDGLRFLAVDDPPLAFDDEGQALRVRWMHDADKIRMLNAANIRCCLQACRIFVDIGSSEELEAVRKHVASEWGVDLPRIPAMVDIDIAVKWVLDQSPRAHMKGPKRSWAETAR